MKSANWETSSPQRILLIKPSAIGDVVHALPVLALLRRKWPAAHIAWLVTPGCSSLIEGHPLLNEVILFERYTERELLRFDPSDADAAARAQRTIYDLTGLTDEEKCFAHFWSGYFYAHAVGRHDEDF